MYAANHHIIKIPALGRKVSLGQLYDCRSDSVLTGKYLWDPQTVSRTSKTRPRKSSNHSVSVDNNVKDKMKTLGIEGELMVSFLGDLIPFAGSSWYMKNQKISKTQEKVTLKYRCTTRHEELDLGKLKKERVTCPDVFASGTGTHVVCGVLYGGQALFVFDKLTSGETFSSTNGLYEAVRKLPTLRMESGRIDISRSLEEEISGVRCQVHSDFKIPYRPNGYKDAAMLFKSLTHFVEGSGAQAVPVEIWLYPLCELDPVAAQVVRSIDNNLFSQLEKTLSHLDQVVVECQDMLYRPVVKKLPGMKQNIDEFGQLVTSYKKYLQSRIGPIVTRLRSGNVNDKVLETILSEKEKSPFASHQLDVWVKQKHVQLQILSHEDSTSVTPSVNGNTPSLETSSSLLPYSPSESASSNHCYQDGYRNDSSSMLTGTSLLRNRNDPASSPIPPSTPSKSPTGDHYHQDDSRHGSSLTNHGLTARSPLRNCNSSPWESQSSWSTESSLSKSPISNCYFQDDYRQEVFSHMHVLTVCFHVSMQGKHSLTKLMKSYLQQVTGGYLQKLVSDTAVHINHKTHENTLLQAELFKEFVEANRYNDALKFTFKEDLESSNKPDVYVSVSRDDVVLHDVYQPPSSPGIPRLEVALHDRLQFQWTKPAHGEKNVTFYEIQYKETNGSYGETVQVDANPRKNFSELTGLKLGSTYEVKLRAVCEIGVSVWSQTATFKTLPATPPGKPIATHKIPSNVHVQWPKPLEIAPNTLVQSYIISVHDLTDGEKYDVTSDPRNGEEFTFDSLKSTSTYTFQVRAAFTEGETERGEVSDILEPKPNTVMKGKLLKDSKRIKRGKPAVQQLNIKQTLLKRHEKIRKCELGKGQEGVPEKVIMVVGATGAGKTTLINGLVNYILGVDWKDNFRFQLIVDTEEAQQRTQAKSQTRWITSYTLHHQEGFEVPYTLTVIDTPGFGDTSGIKRDQEITQQIRNFFTTQGDEGIDHIDAIGFVTQASLPRLTPTQRFIFDQVLALFGKDISDNIFLLVTFADGQRPPVLEGVKEAEIPYKKFFKFNNSALFAGNGEETCGSNRPNGFASDGNDEDDDGGFDRMFWDMGEKSFSTFFKSLNKTESKSLVLTKDVLNERHRLETHVAGIHQHIRTGLNKLEQLRTEVDVLKRHETDIEMNKDFTYTVTEEAVKTVNIPTGTYITNCLTCNFTCHYPCGIPDDADKRGCAAMDSAAGVCNICPARCVWNVHKNMSYRFEIQQITKTKTAEELKARYEAASGEKLSAEELVKKVIDDFENVQLQVIFYTDMVRKSLDRLKDIALKPNPLSTVEYIDILIMSEKTQHLPGWKERLQQLEEVRTQAETLQQLAKPGFDPFEEYKKTYFDMRKKGAKEETIFQTVKKMFKNFL